MRSIKHFVMRFFLRRYFAPDGLISLIVKCEIFAISGKSRFLNEKNIQHSLTGFALCIYEMLLITKIDLRVLHTVA